MNVIERAGMHAALGEPVRLAMVDDLAVSDRAPVELAERHGLASNLLAHHLDVLEQAGLIERSRSSGDGRRRYVRLRHEVLDVLGVGVDGSGWPGGVCVHPQLGSVADGGGGVVGDETNPGVECRDPSRRSGPSGGGGCRSSGRIRPVRISAPVDR